MEIERALEVKSVPIGGRFKCERCGKIILVKPKAGNYLEFAPAGMVVDCRWNGRTWEHHHGYPVGHIPMKPVPPDEW